MELPQDFSPFEHLQDMLRQYHNRRVNQEFQDAIKEGVLNTPDLTKPRHNLYIASKMDDGDTATMSLMRLFLFYIIIRKSTDFMPEIYGIPSTAFQDAMEFKPQLKLYFCQNEAEAMREQTPVVTGEINVRLRNETLNTLTKSDLQVLAQKIKSLFATGSLFTWHKGTTNYTYVDKQKSYYLQILAINETEARRVIEQVLDIQNDEPNWENLTIHDPKRNFPVNPGTQVILGKTYKKPRRRPVEVVRFRYATIHIHGLPNAINLVDATGRRKNPILRLTSI